MFYTEFDDFLPPEDRECNKEGGGFYPENLRQRIDEMNEWGEYLISSSSPLSLPPFDPAPPNPSS